MFENFPDLLTVKQIQEILSIGRSKAYSLLHDGEIKSITIGKQIRIPKRYLLDYLAELSYNNHSKNGVGYMEGSLS